MKYSDIRENLQTGDLILFSGKGQISTGIKWFTHSKWSHIGMVIKIPEQDLVLLWESTTLSNVRDVESDHMHKGVQLVLLTERLNMYNGEASVRYLTAGRTKAMLNDLMDFRKLVKDRPYEESQMELIRSAYDGPFGENKEDLSSLFCSELVAEAYQVMGLLDETKPSNEYTPADFSDKKQLDLLNGSLSKEIPIVS